MKPTRCEMKQAGARRTGARTGPSAINPGIFAYVGRLGERGWVAEFRRRSDACGRDGRSL